MRIFTTTESGHFPHSGGTGRLRLTPTKYAQRVLFRPVGEDASLGIYAAVPAPLAGRLGSIAVCPTGAAASGDMFVTLADPTVSYEGAFLHVICENIPVTSKGPAMWRKTDIHHVLWSTVQVNQGLLYLIVLNGPTLAADAVLPADVALTTTMVD